MTLAAEKQAARQALRKKLSELPPDTIAAASERICNHLQRLASFQRADTVFCFASMEREVQTGAFLRQVLLRGKRLCVPLCVGKGKMELHWIKDLDCLVPGAYGIPEPPDFTPVLQGNEVDFAVIPCLSCNRAGERLGRGGGYYDRFLADYNGASALVCLEELMQAHIPTETCDQKIQTIVTQRGIIFPRSP